MSCNRPSPQIRVKLQLRSLNICRLDLLVCVALGDEVHHNALLWWLYERVDVSTAPSCGSQSWTRCWMITAANNVASCTRTVPERLAGLRGRSPLFLEA